MSINIAEKMIVVWLSGDQLYDLGRGTKARSLEPATGRLMHLLM